MISAQNKYVSIHTVDVMVKKRHADLNSKMDCTKCTISTYIWIWIYFSFLLRKISGTHTINYNFNSNGKLCLIHYSISEKPNKKKREKEKMRCNLFCLPWTTAGVAAAATAKRYFEFKAFRGTGAAGVRGKEREREWMWRRSTSQ